MFMHHMGQLAGYKRSVIGQITYDRWGNPPRENPRRVSVITQLQSIEQKYSKVIQRCNCSN